MLLVFLIAHIVLTYRRFGRDIYAVGGNLAHQGTGYGDEDDVLLLTLRFASGAVATGPDALETGAPRTFDRDLAAVELDRTGCAVEKASAFSEQAEGLGENLLGRDAFEDAIHAGRAPLYQDEEGIETALHPLLVLLPQGQPGLMEHLDGFETDLVAHGPDTLSRHRNEGFPQAGFPLQESPHLG